MISHTRLLTFRRKCVAFDVTSRFFQRWYQSRWRISSVLERWARNASSQSHTLQIMLCSAAAFQWLSTVQVNASSSLRSASVKISSLLFKMSALLCVCCEAWLLVDLQAWEALGILTKTRKQGWKMVIRCYGSNYHLVMSEKHPLTQMHITNLHEASQSDIAKNLF